MDQLDRLVAIEAIKNVKARYWYCMDTKDWAGLLAVFTDDAIFDMRADRAFHRGERGALEDLEPIEAAVTSGDKGLTIGAEAITNWIREAVETWKTVHHGHAPIIEVDAPDHGTGIWPLMDYIDDGASALKGYGHYHEEYLRVGDRWLISKLQLTRIRTDGADPLPSDMYT